jgi:hypothetical protein
VLCYHYGVELHNFTPNAISQAATFVGMCEGFLGIPVNWDPNWDPWVHLFRAELHTPMLPYTLHGTRSVILHLVNSRTIRLSKRTKKRITRD